MPLAIAVQLLFRVDGHDVADEVEVAEGNTGFDAVGGNAAVGAERTSYIYSSRMRFWLSCWKASAVCKAIYFLNLDFAGEVKGDLDANCNVGNMELKLTGEEQDYNYSLSCGVGSIKSRRYFCCRTWQR